MTEHAEPHESPEEAPVGTASEAAARARWTRVRFSRGHRERVSVVSRFRPRPWVLLLLGAVVLGLFLPSLTGVVRRWLGGRAEYQIALDQARLVPEPPGYLKGGARMILGQVRRGSRLPERLSSLETDVAALARAFALGSPWIEEVRGVNVGGIPPALTIHLAYREPTAFVVGSANRLILLDRQGVVLPVEDVDSGALRHLLRLTGWTVREEVAPGLALAAEDSDAEGRLRAGLALAAFVQSCRLGAEPRGRLPEIESVNVRWGPNSLYLLTSGGLWILWGDAPGAEPPEQLSAQQKWGFLLEWTVRNTLSEKNLRGRYLVFGAGGARLEGERVEGTSGGGGGGGTDPG